MKGSKILITLGMIGVLAGGWGVFWSKNIHSYLEYKNLLASAEDSLKDGLYEQAIERYQQSLSYSDDIKTYQKIKEIYDLYYAEEPTAYVRNCYIGDMSAATVAYPKQAEFWQAEIEVYMEGKNDSKAYAAAKKALNSGAKSEELTAVYQKLLYEVKLDYQLYTEFKTCLNGYITVCDGDKWQVLDGKGEKVSSQYQFIGLINDEGDGIYTNDIDTRLLDKKEVTRARFEITVQDAGYYSETSGYVPVKVDDKWKYLNTDGKYLPGEYDQAGSFYNHKAAVLQGEKWFLIDDTGKTVSDNYEDMKLDLYGSYVQGGVILAKKDGAYHIYDLEENQIGDFSCDGMDICIDGGLIAFKQGDKWGYVDVEGNIAVEPQYAGAKSFSDHLAAICDENGYWGFINSRYEQVIESDYLDAYYFNSDETCMVSASDGTYQIMRFVFE